MKLQSPPPSLPDHPVPSQVLAAISTIRSAWNQQKLPRYLFLALCFNLIVAPVVYAATDQALSRPQAWFLGLLGLATAALSIYLFFVMFTPEKF